MTHPTPIRLSKSQDEEITAARIDLEDAMVKARSLLALHRDEARFSLKASMHPFHQAIRERDGTWTKQSLLEILEPLNEALETRIWKSADGIFLPYPSGPQVSYSQDHGRYAFNRVIRVAAPLIIRVARVIGEAEYERDIPHASDAKKAWHRMSGLLRKIAVEVREEILMMEYELARRKRMQPLLPSSRRIPHKRG